MSFYNVSIRHYPAVSTVTSNTFLLQILLSDDDHAGLRFECLRDMLLSCEVNESKKVTSQRDDLSHDRLSVGYIASICLHRRQANYKKKLRINE